MTSAAALDLFADAPLLPGVPRNRTIRRRPTTRRANTGYHPWPLDGRPLMIDRPLTKAEAMRLVGNSVPKRMAMLLAQANAIHALDMPLRAQAAE